MQKSKYKIGENRLVFATKGQTDVPPSIAEAPTPSLSDLSKDIAKDPTNLNESIKRLGASWKDLTDATERITNIFKRFDVDVDEEEIEATLREPGANPDSADTTEAEPTDWKEKKPVDVSFKDYKHAEKASNELNKHKDWMEYIKASAQNHNIPVSTIVAFIAKESGFNPNSKCPRSSARGLAQALEGTWETYQNKTGQPNADQFNPKDSIDFMAWYCRDLINSVNAKIDREGLSQDYKLSGADVKNLYISYNQGPAGYLLLRTYLDNPTAANFNAMCSFQKCVRGRSADGKPIYGWQARADYAGRVASVAQAYANPFKWSDFKRTA